MNNEKTMTKPCENCGGPEGYPSAHAVGCPIGALERQDAAPKVKKPRAAKPWKCQECGKRFTTKGAERAMLGDNGCPGCGGSDIDLEEV